MKKRAAKKARVVLPPISVATVLDECVAGMSMIEVTARSLEDNEKAASERVTLKRALETLWIVHDYLAELPKPDSQQ